MVFTAVWFALLALPLLVAVPSPKPELLQKSAYPGFFGGYRKLWAEIRGEWRRDRNVIYYLIASAVFRDGLTGVVHIRRPCWASVSTASQKTT